MKKRSDVRKKKEWTKPSFQKLRFNRTLGGGAVATEVFDEDVS